MIIMKKSLVIGLLTLFIITAFVPSINANIYFSNQDEQRQYFYKTNSDNDLKIVFVWGGRSVNAFIKNKCDYPLIDTPWEIGLYHWHGGSWGYANGTIEKLEPGEITKITLQVENKLLMVVEVLFIIGNVRENFDAWWIGGFIIFGIFR